MNCAISIFTAAILLLSPQLANGDAGQKPQPLPVVNPIYSDVLCPVITYHDFIYPESDKEAGPWVCDINKFESDIKSLIASGYTFISSADYYSALTGKAKLPQKPVILHFDDGYLSNYTLAYPVLQLYNVKADIFVVTDHMDDAMASSFSWEQAREMEESGLVTIYLHGKSHHSVLALDGDELTRDHEQGWQRIENELGKRTVRAYVYPGGEHSAHTIGQLYEEGDHMQFVWVWGYTKGAEHYPLFYRINMAGDSNPITDIEWFNKRLTSIKKSLR